MYLAGNYGGAAPLYQRLAEQAEKKLSPPAPWLHLQAGRSLIRSGNCLPAMKALEHGLSLIISAGSADRAFLVGQQLRELLVELGREDEAGELAQFLRFGLPGYAAYPFSQPAQIGRPLPETCPRCEGPILLAEVAWRNSHTAECAYCGNPVRVLKKVPV
jgi:hypothetical protein